MTFSSIPFLFYFFPPLLLLVLSTFYVGKHLLSNQTVTTVINAELLLASLLFYFWGEGALTGILLFCIATTYLSGLFISKYKSSESAFLRNLPLAVGAGASLSILLWFKYSSFGWNILTSLTNVDNPLISSYLATLALPLGISFFTFQSLSYLFDIKFKRIEPTQSFLRFACYITFFPQLIAGPIVRFIDIREQLTRRTINLDALYSGCSRFIVGLAKKVLIANPIGRLADDLFATPTTELGTVGSWLAAIAFGMQILFDFSGYSDMAIGIGRMMGINIPENFNSPYKATSVRDFWRRWHISLSSWFRDYIYIPLGGSRSSKGRAIRNLCIVFPICGLWHGASINFLLWGCMHAILVSVDHIVKTRNIHKKIPISLYRIYTLIVVTASWILFRSESIPQAISLYKSMLIDFSNFNITNLPFSFHSIETQAALLLAITTSILPNPLNSIKKHQETIPYQLTKTLTLIIILSVCYVSIISSSHEAFIYFRF